MGSKQRAGRMWTVAFSAVLLALVAVPSHTSATVNGIKTGDFWEYSVGGLGGLNATGNITMRMTVADTLRETIGGRTESVLRLNLSGSGDLRVQAPGLGNATATLALRGSIDRLQSNFSEAHSTIIADLQVTQEFFGSSITVPVTAGLTANLSQPLDDYIGDHELSLGTEVTSNTRVAVGTWYSSIFLGGNQTNRSEATEQVTMKITRAGVSVTVPAGTFSCWEVQMSTATNATAGSSLSYWFYNETVGNYVQVKGLNASAASFFGGNMNLTDFQYGKSKSFSLTSTEGLAAIGLALAAGAAVVVLIALRSARRKRSIPPAM